jgi:UDP-glucose 4-epimerase
MKTIVVTGCAGLLGSHFTRHLIAQGYRVIGIDDLSGGYVDYLPKATVEQFEFWPIDLSKKEAKGWLHNIFTMEKDVVACYHFAAYAAEGLSPFIRHFNYSNNVLSSVNIINACIQNDVKMIFTSSMAVYGNQEPPFVETMTPKPIDPYGVSKYAVEMDMEIAGNQHGLRYSIVRPHNIIGIYQNIWDRYRNVVGIFIRRVMESEPLLIYGDGNQTREFSDVRFYMEPFEKLMDDSYNGETFNLGADKNWTLNELAEAVRRVAMWNECNPVPVKHIEPRHEAKHTKCDHSKAKDLLRFNDGTYLIKTIDEMFQWAKTQPKREQVTMKYEITEGMYDCWK